MDEADDPYGVPDVCDEDAPSAATETRVSPIQIIILVAFIVFCAGFWISAFRTGW